MKRVIFLLLACLLLPAPSGLADVLIEPRDSFYESHRAECVYHGRVYYANGENGWVSVKTSPGSKIETEKLRNGSTVYILYTYDRNGTWGVYDAYSGHKGGWVPMDSLVIVYDGASFEEEHKSEFHPYTGGVGPLIDAGAFALWTWPGSGETAMPLQMIDGDNSGNLENMMHITDAYTDPDGREWGRVSYLYGVRGSWVCFSDPANTDIAAFNAAPKPDLVPPPDVWPPPGGNMFLWVVIGLVAAAVVATAVLIKVFYKPVKGGEAVGNGD